MTEASAGCARMVCEACSGEAGKQPSEERVSGQPRCQLFRACVRRPGPPPDCTALTLGAEAGGGVLGGGGRVCQLVRRRGRRREAAPLGALLLRAQLAGALHTAWWRRGGRLRRRAFGGAKKGAANNSLRAKQKTMWQAVERGCAHPQALQSVLGPAHGIIQHEERVRPQRSREQVVSAFRPRAPCLSPHAG
jgi:hypothetical protein